LLRGGIAVVKYVLSVFAYQEAYADFSRHDVPDLDINDDSCHTLEAECRTGL